MDVIGLGEVRHLFNPADEMFVGGGRSGRERSFHGHGDSLGFYGSLKKAEVSMSIAHLFVYRTQS